MKNRTSTTLSKVPIQSALTVHTRTTQSTLHLLEFIHRFRHVTTRHIQLNLQHPTISKLSKQLTRLRAKGYVGRHYSAADRATNRPASYYITPEGVRLLRAKYPERKYRQARSLKTDATMGLRSRERYHALANVYAHFKRHHDTEFEFFTAFDIAGLDYMPDKTPDGYVRLTMSDGTMFHLLIEIYGWNRSTQEQQRRIYSYLSFAESERWQAMTGALQPALFVVCSNQTSQHRINEQLKNALSEAYLDDFYLCTTSADKLDSEKSTIWHGLIEPKKDFDLY